ncbi:MAG TPA: hypothetical protein VK928_03385 [Longimicrobiales bacterium]|nr:hypothetical protein [Longimicrobiales bacterium]
MPVRRQYSRVIALWIVCGIAAACGDTPSEPQDAVNPALVDAAADGGFGAGTNSLPQGAALFIGPGGMRMDATADEFVQQLTRKDGVVWKTSGIKITAVPDESVSNPLLSRLAFAVAHPGSLESVQTGEYAMVAEWPGFSFVDPSLFAYASFTVSRDQPSPLASEGRIRIISVEYFQDRYTCNLNIIFAVDRCEYRIGVLRGVVEFKGTLADGTPVVQPSTPFALPIQQRTIIMREK